MQEYAAENASLRQLSRHYASGVISLVEYRLARHSLLQALEAGTAAPQLPVLDEIAEEQALATVKQAPFAESGEWHVDETVMTAALAVPGQSAAEATNPTEPGVAALPEPVPADAESGMDANSWTLLVIILVVTVAIAIGVLVYVFKL